MTPFEQYLKQIEANLRRENATEHTHRPALQALVQSLAKGITATNEPKREECGAPDYIVTKGETPLGYIEAKDVGIALTEVEKSEQLQRYFGLSNLILTDYLEFRWYVLGQKRMTARLARVAPDGKLHAEPDGEANVAEILNSFLNAEVPTVNNPKQLAERMARLARVMRPIVFASLEAEDEAGSLRQLMEGFRKVLLHDLTDEQFADMYAQTLCYGLFAARCNHRGAERFDRRSAPYDLPKINPFLRELFNHFAGPDLDGKPYAWAVDDLADLLNRSDMSAILADFGARTRREDPVVHFYETFLAAYDPKMREARGVYYTPAPVVSYIVRSVDHILKTDFGLKDGLADASMVKVKTPDGEDREMHKVQILDPATGTGTFLYGVVNQIYQTFLSNKGMWPGYVRDHLLPRLFGFELLMAPYAVAHLKLGLQLEETGYDFEAGERLNVFLTNTLEEAFATETLPFWGRRIAEEANAAGHVKQNYPIMVILGNPPYSYASENRGAWISGLMRDYYQIDGQPLGERNPKGLQDDYVKFIRFAQRRIEQTGYGVLAYISNHGYLDNPTFRGMRRSLLNTFDTIYVVDLHGNTKKHERSPHGSSDENVFDIQQGVAIGICVKRQPCPDHSTSIARVWHASLWGTRDSKYVWLQSETVASTSWQPIEPRPPLCFFTPMDTSLDSEYALGTKVTDILPAASSCMNTARDGLVIDVSKQELESRIRQLAESDAWADDVESLGIHSTGSWNVTTAIRKLKETPSWSTLIVPCLYRPFDHRWLFNDPDFVDRPRTDLNSSMLRPNVSLVTTRQTKEPFAAVATDRVCGQHKIAAVYDRSFFLPLYMYPADRKAHLFDDVPTTSPGGRQPNLAGKFTVECETRLGLSFVTDGKGDLTATFGPEDVFAYIYAVLYSPTYRSRYAEFLKIDFPRVPLTSSPDLFRALCALGGELVGLHLMEKSGPNLPNYPVALPGTDEMKDRVDEVRYTAPGHGAELGRVWINKQQYFAGIPPEVWEFHIGGYQVCHKWLKDRKGRTLSYDDQKHYQQTIAALAETIRLMSDIDAAIAAHGGWPLVGSLTVGTGER